MESVAELARLIDRFATSDGVNETALPRVKLARASQPVAKTHSLQVAAMGLTVQGRKRVMVGDEVYEYDPSRYIVSSVDVPVVGQVLDATPDKPYLAFVLELDPHELASLVLQAPPASPTAAGAPRRGVFVAAVDAPLVDAVLRLVRLLETPGDIPALAPLAEREVLYRLLRGPQGARVSEVAIAHSHAHRIGRAIQWLRANYREPLRIEHFARLAHMSPSTLHHHFKAVTAMSPLQFQKRLRLQEARRLLLAEGLDAATAAHRVGYESASQFSREYSRLFGEPPARDRRRLREMGVPAPAG
jgi:AraC-like DNA-binding protein